MRNFAAEVILSEWVIDSQPDFNHSHLKLKASLLHQVMPFEMPAI
jgi:hypothetical protein